MRNISFALTTEQVRQRRKTVTRRVGWLFLKPGDRLRAVVKAQGLKKGEHVEPLGVIEVTNVRRERLRRLIDDHAYGAAETQLEGFAGTDLANPALFVGFFVETHGCTVDDLVTRIEFRYVEEPPA